MKAVKRVRRHFERILFALNQTFSGSEMDSDSKHLVGCDFFY